MRLISCWSCLTIFLSKFHCDDVYEIPKMKLRMINKLSLSAFSMKKLATKGREKIIWEKKNQWRKQINKSQTKCRFPNVPFAKHTLFYMKMQVFLFSFLNVMNAEKKLGALDQ